MSKVNTAFLLIRMTYLISILACPLGDLGNGSHFESSEEAISKCLWSLSIQDSNGNRCLIILSCSEGLDLVASNRSVF